MSVSTPVENEGTLDLGRSLQHRQRKGLNPSVQKDAAQQGDEGMSVSNEDEESSGTSSDDTSSDSSSEDGDSDEEDEEQVIEMNLDLGVLEQVKNTSSNLDMTNGTFQPPVASASAATSKRQPINKDGDVINFQPQNKKPKFVLTPDPNSVASRLPGFLDQIRAANAELEKRNTADYRMEIVDDATAEEDRKLTPVGIEEL